MPQLYPSPREVFKQVSLRILFSTGGKLRHLDLNEAKTLGQPVKIFATQSYVYLGIFLEKCYCWKSSANSESYILFGEQPKRTTWNVKYIYFIPSNAFYEHTFRQTFVHLSFTSTNTQRKYILFWLLAHTDVNII